MATSTKYPTATATTNAVAPYDDMNFNNIAGIKASGGGYASLGSFGSSIYSYLAKAQTFAFAIPSDAIIDGLVVGVGSQSSGTTYWHMMKLLNASGTAEGDNNAADHATMPVGPGAQDFGGAADKWGVALTPAMVNDADFGVQFALQAGSTNRDIYIDYLSMTVYYTPAATGAPVNLLRPRTIPPLGGRNGF